MDKSILNFNLKIIDIKSIREIANYWSKQDYLALLEAFDFTDFNEANDEELREYLEMAISDLEPNESAEILLEYKLSDKLNKNQIQNMSHEMMEDNESEENSDIALHYPLFNINQLLFSAYNGVFPNAKASYIDIELAFTNQHAVTLSKSIVLMAMSKVLRLQNLILRLYPDQLAGKEPFDDADKIIWELENKGNNNYGFITSDYWINKEDINVGEIDGSIHLPEIDKN